MAWHAMAYHCRRSLCVAVHCRPALSIAVHCCPLTPIGAHFAPIAIHCHSLPFIAALCHPSPSSAVAITVHCRPLASIAVAMAVTGTHCCPLALTLPSIAIHCRHQSTATTNRDTERLKKGVHENTSKPPCPQPLKQRVQGQQWQRASVKSPSPWNL